MAVSEAASDEILIENCDNHIVVITLNRPERMNAISRDMLEELSKKMTEANKDPEIRCIVLTGSGRGFCAGLDLVDTAKGALAQGRRRGTIGPSSYLICATRQ